MKSSDVKTKQPIDTEPLSDASELPRSDEAVALVSELLGQAERPTSTFAEARVGAWADERGTLDNGQPVRLAASCLTQPMVGDRVLFWTSEDGAWILSVLERADDLAPVTLRGKTGVALEAPRVLLRGKAVHIAADEFLSSVRNRHAVERTRTEHSKLRVSQVGTDIRRVDTAEERVSGTLVQRTGTWLSSTVREARLKARSFLFE